MQYTCFMGLFTKISRAWLTIDNLIFFWNYEDGYVLVFLFCVCLNQCVSFTFRFIYLRSDICFYDNLNEAILAVELFQPKRDTFPVGVEYGLCIATCNYVVLLSIEFIRYTKGIQS